MSKQREKLIELLQNVPRNTRTFYDQFADYLLANGVIVPPCKIGDTAWYISEENPFTREKELEAREEGPIDGIFVTNDGFYICPGYAEIVAGSCDKVNEGEMFGFISKEAAEAALKARDEG